MEKLVQQHIRYFYHVMITGILIQLLSVIYSVLHGHINLEIFSLMFLSIINIMLLMNNLRHNIKQRFTECKISSKVLRYTLGLLLLLQCEICYTATGSIVMLFNHLMAIGVIEIVLTYRIKTIEYLEDLVGKYKYSLKKEGVEKECKG